MGAFKKLDQLKMVKKHFPVLFLNKKAKLSTSDWDVFMVYPLSIVWRCPRAGSFFILLFAV